MALHAMVGGFGASKPADDDVRAIVADATVRAGIQDVAGAFSSLEVREYKTQVVAGTNFLIHVVADGKDFTVKVHRPLPHTHKPLEVMNVEEGNKLA